MNIQEILDEVSEATGVPKNKVKQVLQLGLEKIMDRTLAGENVAIPKIGTFSLKTFPEKTKTNPETGETKTIPARSVPIFKVSKQKVKNALELEEDDEE